MRVNEPVTQREHPFPSGQALVSTTDLKGRILHCNAAFIEVSGYSREELLGQPHNLIRHPDVPEEAFRDLWATIERGLPWSGIVKNRCKNGDHYWVSANVTPLMEGDKPVAYMSVRTEPSRAQIQAAEALYARMRERPGAIRLHRGRVLHGGWRGWLASLRPQRFAGTPAFLAMAALGWFASQLTPAQALALLLPAALALAWWSSGRCAAALRVVNRYANQLAAGDLSRELPAQGRAMTEQLEAALRQLSVNMRALVSDTQAELQRMAGVSREIAQGNQDLARRTEAQAANLEQTAASVEQITGTVRHSTASADQAATTVREVGDVAQRSAEVVQSVNATMAEIARSSQRIGDISQTIDGIAFQTNLLALNAAVEAARAGEHGKGFAVVASEVRALAQRSSAASREIRQLTQAAHEKVEAGSSQTAQARERMDQTLASVQRVAHLIEDIDRGAREQLGGISQIHDAMHDIEDITTQNAALVQQLAGSSARLLERSREVETALAVFRLRPGQSREVLAVDAVTLRRQAKAQPAAR
ncbi:methyl-accepting chemotaxis protein [Pelomonas sp. CA6]|uniref:methyl-accepting chemotaxis protein n=1 Tax=Pelomonas sp. CA6 TaxID=2907999 RepID=UPI001F4C4874|nr:PAS domain-containing methyl-accepting chemotaxis protein [Pelomonas sp. CA6]MCH7345596.1 methyl-accepting chemotaxis protein [Pelomonas sp. CA6]